MTTNASTEKDDLIRFFTLHLSRMYYGKQHVINKLPHLHKHGDFIDLKHAIAEMQDDLERQIARIELIFALLESKIIEDVSGAISGCLEDAYRTVENDKEPRLRDMSILYYLQVVETIEMAGFKLMRMVAVKLKNKQVKQLLLENYDEAKASRTLMLLITTKLICK